MTYDEMAKYLAELAAVWKDKELFAIVREYWASSVKQAYERYPTTDSRSRLIDAQNEVKDAYLENCR